MTNISPALRRRLPIYFRTLIRLYGDGKERVSSDELARELGLVPSQVRTDMKAIGCVGQRSYGYGIPTLYKTIAGILQLSDKYRAVIVGSTHLAKAIAEDQIFSKRGIKLSAVFSDKSSNWSLLPECELLPTARFMEYFLENRPNIVILACETALSPEIFGFIESSAENSDGICHEVWNFTDKELVSGKLKVKNIHITDFLLMLCLEAGH